MQVETRFNTPCVKFQGYWIPRDRLDLVDHNLAEDVLTLPSTQTATAKDILSYCQGNEIDKLINFYQELHANRNDSALLKIIMFPSSVLDKTPYASCVEENNATKLAILLSAASGNIEAQVLALDILLLLGAEPTAINKIEACKISLQKRLSKIDANHSNTSDLLGLSTLSSLELQEEAVITNIRVWERNKERSEKNSNARTLLRIANRYLLKNQSEEAKRYLELSADKGSARAVITMTHLIAHRSENRENRFTDIQSLLEKYKGCLGGYEHLLPAYYYQYGSLDLVLRNLQKANQEYKSAISKNCREAAFEYGEFLMSMFNTCREEDSRKTEFHKQAIIAYEKAGDLGLEAGYSKALELLSKSKKDGNSTEQDEIRKKLENSKIFFHSLDDIAVLDYEAIDKKRRTEAVDRPKFMDAILLKILDGFN